MTAQLEDALLGDGFERGRFAMRGSSVTGRKFDRDSGLYDGPHFDTHKRSDWDLAVVDENLFKYVLRHARQERIDIRGGRTRTKPARSAFGTDLGAGPDATKQDAGFTGSNRFSKQS